MPYTQHWGISRNAFQSPLKQDEETTLDTDKNLEENVDTSTENPSVDIIEQNNIAAGSTTSEFPTHGSDEEKKEWYSKYNKGPVIAPASEENTQALQMGLGDAADLSEEEKRILSGKGRTLDYINMAGTAAGMTPAYGALADAGNTIFSAGRTLTNFIGDTARSIKNRDVDYSRTLSRLKDTGFALGGIIPVGGQILNTGKLTKNVIGASKEWKALKGLKLGDQVADVTQTSNIKGPRMPIATMPSSISTFTGKIGSKIASWFQN